MPKLPDVLARCLRVFVLIVVGVALSKAWVVHVLGLVDASEWNTLTLELRTAGATLFVAFVIWELLKFVTDPYVAPKPQKASGGGGSGPAASPSASRLSTLVPLLRVALGIVIGLVAVLIVLADFGVNITPLLAGASILGLAVSFGSQALVKDIVSGIFYLTDDAFRAGEYIECGQTKGIVEGFTLRSIRLRHPSGQLHTIPFGDLGKIANFSRDWAIVKYDFSFPATRTSRKCATPWTASTTNYKTIRTTGAKYWNRSRRRVSWESPTIRWSFNSGLPLNPAIQKPSSATS